VDKLTLPFVRVLLKRIMESPGADNMAAANYQQARADFDRKQAEAWASLPVKRLIMGKTDGE
jgi:hypothetical protein